MLSPGLGWRGGAGDQRLRTCIEQHFDTVQMLAGAGNMQRGPKVAVVRFQVGPNIDQKPHTLGTSLKETEAKEKASCI